jgi:hypothetical protein
MARDNRNTAVRGNRSTFDLGGRRRTEREAELTIRDGVKVLRLVFQGVSLVVRYHEEGETDEAFDALRLRAESLDEAAGHLGWGDRANAELVLDPIEAEVGLMYDVQTADRLVQAFRQCFDRPGLRGSR